MTRILTVVGALAFAGAVGLAVGVFLLFPPGAARRSALTRIVLQSQQVQGAVFFAPGDKYASVELPDDLFDSVPVVVASSASGVLPYSIGRLRANGFRIELAARAKTRGAFLWQAGWDRFVEKEYVEQIAGMPASVPFEWQGRVYRARYTGYDAYLPTELAIVDVEPDSLAGSEAPFVETVLDAARRDYHDRTFCTLLERARRRLGLRLLACPPRWMGSSLPPWNATGAGATGAGEWVLAPAAQGVRLHRTATTAAPTREEVVALWAGLLRSANAVDLSPHNNQLVDFLEEVAGSHAPPRGSPEGGWTLVRFDTHSDLYVAADPNVFQPSEEIADFLNVLLETDRIAEIFWVLPDWSRDAAVERVFWSEELPRDRGDDAEPYLAGPRVLDLHVRRSTRQVHVGDPPETIDPADLRRVRLWKVALDELPRFRPDARILLEVDADYFSNSGVDTTVGAAWNPDRSALLRVLATVARRLEQSGVRPMLAYFCLSRDYVGPEDQGEILGVVADAMEQNGQSDLLVSYRHGDVFGVAPGAVSRRRSSALEQMFWQLQRIDARHWPADRRIFLRPEDAEYRAAIESMDAAQLGTLYDASALLARLDRFDGERDRVIDLDDLEQMTAFEDPAWVLSPASRLP